MSAPNRSAEPLPNVAYARPWALLAGLVLIAAGLGLALLRGRPPAPLPVDAPAAEFSAGRAMALVGQLLAEGRPHPVGTEINARVRDRIVEQLSALGYQVEVQGTLVCHGWSGTQATCAPVQNVVTRLPGRADGPAVLVMAHYDSVGAGPGAADDVAGVAAILEIARVLKAEGARRNAVIFLLTEGEEVGLMGARGFVTEHPWAQNLGVVINLEARGTGGQSIMFETSDDNAWLVDAYASSVRLPASNSLTYEVYRALPNDSDLTIFKEMGVAGVNFGFIERLPHYHTPLDSLEYLDAASVQHQGESVLALTRTLADGDLGHPPAGNATYADLLNLGVMRWPAGWTLPLSLAALLILLGCAIVAIRRTALTPGGLLVGLLGALLCVVLAIVLGMILAWFIALVGRGSQPWYAHPLATRVALWAAALLCGGLVAAALGRRAGTWGMGLGAWLLWSILALLLSLTMTGVAVFLVVPALLAALLAAVALAAGARFAPAPGIALAIAAAVAALFFLPLALGLEAAMGFAMSPAITLPVGLAVATLLPLLAVPPDETRLRRSVISASAIVVAVAIVAALLVPPYSEASPQRLSLYYVSEAGSGQARYLSAPADDVTPQPLRGHFEDAATAAFPWSDTQFLGVPAEATGAEGPALEVLSSVPAGENREVTLLLRSPRAADSIQLRVPLARLASIVVAGQELPIEASDAIDSDYSLRCYGLACDGLEVTVELAGTEAASVLVVDYTPGLPASGEYLLHDRGTKAVPSQDGDTTILWRRVGL